MLKQVKTFLLRGPMVLCCGLFFCLISCLDRRETDKIKPDQDILWYLNCISSALGEDPINMHNISYYVDKVHKMISFHCIKSKYKPVYKIKDSVLDCIEKIKTASGNQANNQDWEGILKTMDIVKSYVENNQIDV